MFLFISSGISNLSNKKYVVYFDRSISGLKIGNQVLYKGVPIGFVHDIGVDLPEGKRVKVIIKVSKTISLYEDCTARIGMQGLTGYCVLELSNKGSKTLLTGLMPEIKSEYSMLETLFERLPEMVANANNIITALNDIIQRNKSNINSTIVNLGTTVESMNAACLALRDAAGVVHRFGIRFEENVMPKVESSIADLSKMLNNWNQLSEGSSLQLMEFINNLNNVSSALNEALNSRKGYLGYFLAV